jgi:hypothetical protein
MSILTAAFVLGLLAAPVPPPAIAVDVVFRGLPANKRLQESLMEEVTHIWARYAVDVRRVGAADSGRDGAIRLTVVLADHPEGKVTTDALGSITFVDGEPEPTIVMYPNAVAMLVSLIKINNHPDQEWPFALRDAIYGRVLGRALAHEIGHYLLRSREHSVVGLMRARQSSSDLTRIDRDGFTLSAGDRLRVHALASMTLETATASRDHGREMKRPGDAQEPQMHHV